MIRSAAVTGLGAGVVAVAVVAAGAGSSPVGRPAARPAVSPGVTRAAPSVHKIVVRTVAALSTASQNSVERTVVTTADGVNRCIIDQPDQVTDLVSTSGGRKQAEFVTRLKPGSKGIYQMRVINYRARTWGEQRESESLAIPNPAAEFRASLKPSPNGRARFVGSAYVDGIPAYVLHLTGLRSTRNTATIWISKATYLPIKSVSPGALVRYFWTGPGSVDGAKLWPAVPAGFRKVSFMTGFVAGRKSGR